MFGSINTVMYLKQLDQNGVGITNFSDSSFLSSWERFVSRREQASLFLALLEL